MQPWFSDHAIYGDKQYTWLWKIGAELFFEVIYLLFCLRNIIFVNLICKFENEYDTDFLWINKKIDKFDD